MASALGVSLTHRDCARSVRFVTGHARSGALPDDIDWKAVADPSATTIFYMGGRTAGEIARRLTDAGLAPSTPVVIATNVSRSEQTLRAATLDKLAVEMRAIDLTAPVIIGVGDVFGQRAVESHGRSGVAI